MVKDLSLGTACCSWLFKKHLLLDQIMEACFSFLPSFFPSFLSFLSFPSIDWLVDHLFVLLNLKHAQSNAVPLNSIPSPWPQFLHPRNGQPKSRSWLSPAHSWLFDYLADVFWETHLGKGLPYVSGVTMVVVVSALELESLGRTEGHL